MKKANASRSNKQGQFSYNQFEPRRMLANITVLDIGTNEKASIDNDFVVGFRDGLAATSQHPEFGNELWLSNSFVSDSYFIDVNPGPQSSNPNTFVQAENNLYFFGNQPNGEVGLWVTDGTTRGTELVSDSPDSWVTPYYFDGHVYFTEYDADTFTSSLVRASANGSNTELIVDDLAAFEFEAFGGEVYFKRSQNSIEYLWKTDGTALGTVEVAEAYGKPYASEDSGLLFMAHAPIFSPGELWISDGTTAGTELLRTFDDIVDSPVSEFDSFVVLDGKFYFEANESSSNGLWVSDGTLNGTEMLFDLQNQSSFGLIDQMERHDSEVFFYVDTFTPAEGLYKTDGTVAGTSAVPLATETSSFTQLLSFGNEIFYIAETELLEKEIWATQGTLESNRFVAKIQPDGTTYDPVAIYKSDTRVFAMANAGRLWELLSNGTATQLSPETFANHSSRPNEITTIGDQVVFAANDFLPSVFLSDGTVEGTAIPNGIPPFQFPTYSFFSQPGNFKQLGEKMLFTAELNGGNIQLLSYDIPSDSLTVLYSEVGAFEVVDDVAYFTTLNSNTDHDIWVTDGTIDGTELAIEVGQRIEKIDSASGRLFYEVNFQGLWWTDGTTDGTSLLFSENFVEFDFAETLPDGSTLLAAEDVLWRLDSEGNFLNLTTFSTSGSSSSSTFFESEIVGDNLFFISRSGNTVTVTDGTVAGTRLVDFVNRESGLAVLGTDVYYFNQELELMKTDGTESGTQVVSTSPVDGRSVESFNGKIYFAATSPEFGRELWVSNGTDSGTMVAIDHVTGPAETSVEQLTAAGDHLFFTYESFATSEEFGFLTIETPTGIDFGPSDGSAFEDYPQTFNQTYNPEVGYGWIETTGLTELALNRGNALVNDNVEMQNGLFAVDVLNGLWEVTIHFGVVRKVDSVSVTVEGQTDAFQPQAGPNVSRTYSVNVTDGQIELEFDGAGGLNDRIQIAGISLVSIDNQRPSGGQDASSGSDFGNWFGALDNNENSPYSISLPAQRNGGYSDSQSEPGLPGNQLHDVASNELDRFFSDDADLIEETELDFTDFESIGINEWDWNGLAVRR